MEAWRHGGMEKNATESGTLVVSASPREPRAEREQVAARERPAAPVSQSKSNPPASVSEVAR